VSGYRLYSFLKEVQRSWIKNMIYLV